MVGGRLSLVLYAPTALIPEPSYHSQETTDASYAS